MIANTDFSCNRGAASFNVNVSVLKGINLVGINVLNNSYSSLGGSFNFYGSYDKNELMLEVRSSVFSRNSGSSIWCYVSGSSSISLINVNITDNTVAATEMLDGNAAAVFIYMYDGSSLEVDMFQVHFVSNQYLGHSGGALYVGSNNIHETFSVCISDCTFTDNKSPGHGAALYVYSWLGDQMGSVHRVYIINTIFDKNIAGYSVAYISQVSSSMIEVQVSNSTFRNSVGSATYLSMSKLLLMDNVVFENNTADYGAAVYLDQSAYIRIDQNTNIWFANNMATQNGGAIYINMISSCRVAILLSPSQLSNVTFMNNSARFAGNSLYFDIAKFCKVSINISDPNALMFIPCQFSYYQIINNASTFVSCEEKYTLLNDTGSPIVTSPHELRLYFPNNDGVNISSNADYNIYYMKNNILGHDVIFSGATFDYFGKPTIPSQFTVECINCSTVSLSGDDHLLVDNTTNLSVQFKGDNIENYNTIATLISTTMLLTHVFVTIMMWWSVLTLTMRSKEVTGLVVWKLGWRFVRLHHCVPTIIVTLLSARRPDKDTLNYQRQLVLSVMITGQEVLVESAIVQDTL